MKDRFLKFYTTSRIAFAGSRHTANICLQLLTGGFMDDMKKHR